MFPDSHSHYFELILDLVLRVYPTHDRAITFAEDRLGLSTWSLNYDQPIDELWRDILSLASTKGYGPYQVFMHVRADRNYSPKVYEDLEALGNILIREFSQGGKRETDFEENERNIFRRAQLCASTDRSRSTITDSYGQHAVVEVHFATDRIKKGSSFGNRRSETFSPASAYLSYGTCTVSIPSRHVVGQLESPSLFKFEFKANPNKHVTVKDIKIKSDESFFIDLIGELEKKPGRNAFLFIHGYNVKFSDAARRTAQIHFDLKFDGVPLFYSWPSVGQFAGYVADEATIEWSKSNLEVFIKQLLDSSPIENLYLIGHSMGNRALTRAVISLLAKAPSYRSRIKEVILAAPDIDAGVFVNEIVPAFASNSLPVTLYASSKDKALIASRRIHQYPRAGESGEKMVVDPSIETIDATLVNTNFLGHSYFSSTRTILSDIFHIVNAGLRANKRFGLDPANNATGQYWVIRK